MLDSEFHQGISNLQKAASVILCRWVYSLHSFVVKFERAMKLTSQDANLLSAWTAFALAAIFDRIEMIDERYEEAEVLEAGNRRKMRQQCDWTYRPMPRLHS